MTKDIKLKSTKRKKAASLDKRKARGGWLFVLPFVLGFLLVYVPIIADSLYYTFAKPEFIDNQTVYVFHGFENYVSVLTTTDFVETLVKGLQNLAFDIPMILMFSLFMAVLLNQKMAGRAIFRAIFFIPVILSTGIMETIEAQNIVGDTMESIEGIDDGSGESAASGIVNSMDVQKLFAGMAVGEGLVE